MRWYYYAKTFQFNSNAEMKYFAQMEASNLKKAVQKIKENIRNTLFQWDITETMKKGQNLWEINGKKTLYKKESKNNIIFDWLTNDDGSIQYLPIGEFDVNAIKKDLENDVVKNSKKYAMIKDGAFAPNNNQNFKIEYNGHYFDELITEIKNADDGNGNVKEKILRDLNEGSVFTSSSHKVEPYIKDGKIFKTDDKTYTVSQVLNNDVPTDKINNLRVIGFDGTAINADFQKSVFDNEIFKYNEGNILGQAYLFLMSLPIRTKIFEDGSYIINNGTTLRSLLLREGAYWWRYDLTDNNNLEATDPIKFKQDYAHPYDSGIYITKDKKDNTLSFSRLSDDYLKFSDWSCTDGRKEALKQYFIDKGEKPYRAVQIFEWLYRFEILDWSMMTNQKQAVISDLANHFCLDRLELVERQISSDKTEKFLFRLHDGNLIETVLMNHYYGNSLCVTSQVGCNMGCAFCASGMHKKLRNLETYEMVLQVMTVSQIINKRISHIVIMGIGEPFDNYENVLRFINIANQSKGLEIGARHISVSTCGLVPKIVEFAKESLQTNLAISLHAPTNEIRNQIMPINRVYPLEVLIPTLKEYIAKTNRRVTLEYILLKDINDSIECANKLAQLIRGMNVYVNLIPYNEVKEKPYSRSLPEDMSRFYDTLKKRGINVTLRHEQGHDIDAACGQLRSKRMN